MKLFKTTFTKKSFSEIPIEEQILFVQAGRFINDISVFHKLVSVSYTKYRNDTDLKAKNAQTLTIFLKLIGILYESGIFIKRKLGEKGIVKSYADDLYEEYLTILQELLSYFSRENPIYIIRNKIGFHYLDHIVGEQIIALKDAYSLEVYFEDSHANCLYHSSHIITLCSVLDLIDKNDHVRAWDNLLQEILYISNKIIDMLGEIVSIFTRKYNKSFTLLEEIEMGEPTKLDDIDLPYFVKK